MSVYKDKRTRYCFACVANKNLFYSLGDLGRHFINRHLAYVEDGEGFDYDLCEVYLDNKMYMQRHAFDVHYIVIPASAAAF